MTVRITSPCSYERHRGSDWVTPQSQVICGVCHPPAASYAGLLRRGDDGFGHLAAAAAARVVGVPRCLTCEGRLSEAEARAGAIYCSVCAGQRRPDDDAAVAIAEHEISLERRGMRSAAEIGDELDQGFDAALAGDR